MLRRIATIFVVILLLPVFVSAQEKTILLPSGEIVKYQGDLKNFDVRKPEKGMAVTSDTYKSMVQKNQNSNRALLGGTIDTLMYPGPFSAWFSQSAQDWMVMWFEAPADLNLLQVGFAPYSNADGVSAEVKVVSINWTKEEILSNTDAGYIGYYEATGNGFNDITGFLDNPDITGGWTAIDPFTTEIFGNDIWSDGGVGFSIVTIPVTSEPTYQWVDLSLLEVPQLLKGDLFGIAVKSEDAVFGGPIFGFWYSQSAGVPLFKFYADGRGIAPPDPESDEGWWIRPAFSLLYAAEVELTGDRAPVINSVTTLSSGPDPGPFTVDANITDDNPSGGAAGVASATLKWSNDDGASWNDVAMTGSEPNFSGDIPAQPAGTDVLYWLEATDVASNTTSTTTKTFFVFGSSGAPTLVIYNGLDVSGYPQDWYWGEDIGTGTTTFAHDRWAYGELPLSVANNYTNIIEFGNSGPNDYNDAAIRAWLTADGTRNYFLTGQEWLGNRYGFTDSAFTAGSFEFDILGINQSYNDVSHDGTSGDGIPSLVMPVAGTQFGGPLDDLFNALDPAADSMMYNPVFEIPMGNWIDAFDVEADVIVDMMVETRGIGYAPDVRTLPTMMHRTLPAGNKIVFVAFDPIALNTANDGSFPYYNWIGWDPANVSYQAAFNWFGIPTGIIEVGGAVPEEYSISQNYPNPFNPSTTINFSIPQQSNVVLKVYDILGSEVASLVSETLAAGNYNVNFDASQFASGMYVYKISAGSFVTTKKMMLLK